MTINHAPALHAGGESLDAYLGHWAAAAEGRTSVAQAVAAMAQAGIALSDIIAGGPLNGALGAEVGQQNADGDNQRQLDVIADGLIIDALRKSPTAYYASEEEEAILTLDPAGELAVACRSARRLVQYRRQYFRSRTIFRHLPRHRRGDATGVVLPRGQRAGRGGLCRLRPADQPAADAGRRRRAFHARSRHAHASVLVSRNVRIAPSTREYAINASNYRHWPEPIRAFIDDCIEGAGGPHGKDFNMRWLACMVGETHRIFVARRGVSLSRRPPPRL